MDGDTHNQLLQNVRDYRSPEAAQHLLQEHPPLVIAGVTAAGKDAVAEYIQDNSDWRLVITSTTRKPRPGEKSGEHHWFVDESEMIKLLDAKLFIEAKLVHGEHVYGTSIAAYKSVIEAAHKPILRIDIQGVEEITKMSADVNPVFILPPSFEVWMERLNKRGAMSHIERIRRLKSAKTELEEILRNPRFRLVVNRDVSSVSNEILSGVTDIPSQHRNRELAGQLIEHIRQY